MQATQQHHTAVAVQMTDCTNCLTGLVPVVWWLEGSVGVYVDVCCLVWGQLSQLGTQLSQVQGGDLLIQVLGQHVHLLLVAAACALVPQLQLSNDLQETPSATL